MKLVSLKITSDFKNLKGLVVNFSKGVASHILIGNNGSGKTSVLEALSSIFYTLYSDNLQAFEFGFNLQYKYGDHQVMIIHAMEKHNVVFKVDSNEVDEKTIINYLPSRLICNYSGEDPRLKQKYYGDHWNTYITKLKNTSGQNSLKMWFIDKDMWSIIFLVMLATRGQIESFDKFLTNTLGIKKIDDISIEFDAEALKSWKENSVSFYIWGIIQRLKEGKLNLADINPRDDDAVVLFSNWVGALPVIKNLNISFNDGIDISGLSEGEKKLLVILFIEEVLADQDSLILLDEPDSHIHVARKEELQKLIASSINRENLLTSHSPTLTAKFDSDAIIMLDRKADGMVEVVSRDKQQIVSELTKGLWTLQEQNIFLASSKDIIIVEGKTDEVFLSKALAYLQAQGEYLGLDFSYLPCGGASNVQPLLHNFSPKANQLMACFFDGDGAGWNAINAIFGKPSNAGYQSDSFGKARKLGDIWFAPYPRPKRKPKDFNIEDYFPRSVFLKYVMSFRSLNEIMTKEKIKNHMADDCLNGVISGKRYEKFKAVFDLIGQIRTAEKAGLDKI